MTKEEKNLLLYMETQAVDYGGKLQSVRMNADDFAIAKRWNDTKFVRFGRIAYHDIPQDGVNGFPRNHWCVLSDEAWMAAHAERRARCERVMARLAVQRLPLEACTP